jgi:hypothetical protein
MVTRIPTAGNGRRRILVIAVAILAAVFVAFTALSGFFVDVLWFREVGFSQVFWSILRTKVVLGVMFGLAFFAILYVNLWIVRRITPRYHPMTPEQEIIERYRLQFEPYAWWILPLFAAVIAIFVGLGVTTQWRTFLLWRNSGGVTFGSTEPIFDRDVAFYVFSLPWMRFLQGWFFSALVGVLLITSLAHYLWGGIRPNAPGIGEKVTPQVKAHLSVLLGLIILAKAWGYYLGQFDLLRSTRGVVFGASYTDVNAQLPALRILVFIAIACAILFLVNIRLRGCPSSRSVSSRWSRSSPAARCRRPSSDSRSTHRSSSARTSSSNTTSRPPSWRSGSIGSSPRHNRSTTPSRTRTW